jgi:hypothetical protein
LAAFCAFVVPFVMNVYWIWNTCLLAAASNQQQRQACETGETTQANRASCGLLGMQSAQARHSKYQYLSTHGSGSCSSSGLDMVPRTSLVFVAVCGIHRQVQKHMCQPKHTCNDLMPHPA